ncbi:MAG: hypothetical protein ACI9KE_000253 [Polyangiales bacterium]|jgi:hypothetical protein
MPIELDEAGLVVCDGPADELAVLASLCGRTHQAGARGVRDVEWGNQLQLGNFYFYVMGSPDDIPNLRYAAGVETPEGFEPVLEGRVHTTRAESIACSESFVASAEFLWRNTTIRLQLVGVLGC